MKRYLLYIVLTVVLSTAGCTRGLWLDEVVAQRDEQEDVVPILEAAQEKGLTVNSVEEIERTNKHYTADTANGYYNEFKRYRLLFSDQTTVEFDVLGQLNGVQSDYYAERGLSYISDVHLSDRYVSVMLVDPNNGVGDSFVFLNTSPNAPKLKKIYYTSTDGNIVIPYNANNFGGPNGDEAIIVSNTYENGQGVITFVGEVTRIGYQAFYDCSSLASITIPDSVTEIGDYAFYGCSGLAEFSGKFASEDGRCLIVNGKLNYFAPAGLTEYVIPNGVTTIGRMAFFDCDELVSVTIPDGVTSIEQDAFRDCDNLASINIPEGVTEIGDYAFGITKLTSVTLPESLTSLGYIAFAYCYSLKEVYCKATTPPTAIPDSSSRWDAFDYNASGRKIYVPEESVEAYKTAEWWSDYADAFVPYDFEKGEEVNLESRKIYYTSTDGNVVTPYATNVFGASIISNTYENGQGVIAFAGNVTTIGSHAFESCTSLTSITIPEGVTEIGYQAFYGCSSLASVTLPDSVTEIGGQAFYGCTALTSVTIPDGVTSIGSYVFAGCSGLTEFKGQLASNDGRCLIINGAIHSFAPAGLTGYTIPDGVTSIVATAFYGCASLISITIPDSVTYIGEWAFKDCLSLTSVYCMPTTPPTGGTGRFDNGVVGRKIYVPAESIEAYKSANYWSDYADAFVPYDFEKGEVVNLENRKIYYTSTDGNVVTPNHSGTFYFGVNIISNTYENGQGVITFDGEVTKIGDQAFYDCKSLASITIPESVTSIGDYAFSGCSSLTSITIPDSVTSIGELAFSKCTSLTSITIPDSVTSIGNYAFTGCSSLAEFSGKFASEDGRCLIADGVLHFFTPAAGLTEYIIPNGVTTIGIRAFYDCDELVSVTIPDGVTSIKEDAFRWCDNLASINIPEGVTEIGYYAFGVTKLTNVTLPKSLTSLGYIAFAQCYSLAEVYCKAITPPTAIPDSSSKWGAFNYNASDRKIYVPEESVGAYKTAEWWSEYADAIEPYVFE